MVVHFGAESRNRRRRDRVQQCEGCQYPKAENRARKEGELAIARAEFSLELKDVCKEEGGGDAEGPPDLSGPGLP